MLMGVDDSEVIRAERRLREDRVALAGAVGQFKESCRSSLTSPTTIALLLLAGGLAGAGRSKRATASDKQRISSTVAGIVHSLWGPLVKSVTALAVQRVLRRLHAGAAPSRRYEDL